MVAVETVYGGEGGVIEGGADCVLERVDLFVLPGHADFLGHAFGGEVVDGQCQQVEGNEVGNDVGADVG